MIGKKKKKSKPVGPTWTTTPQGRITRANRKSWEKCCQDGHEIRGTNATRGIARQDAHTDDRAQGFNQFFLSRSRKKKKWGGKKNKKKKKKEKRKKKGKVKKKTEKNSF